MVATHTINLQEQLADRDIPAVAGVLDTPVPVAVLKGRNHYLSLRRWRRFLAAPDVAGQEPDLVSIRFKLKILAWLATTTTGDRSEVYLAGDEEQLWRRVASDVTDCLGPACANWPTARCYMVGARRAAADAAIVVTNHALLLAGNERQGQVLGPYEALVVDEAHHLESVATEQLGLTVRLADLALILDRLPAMPGTPLASALERCREAGQRLFGDAKGFMSAKLGGEHAANGRIGLSEAIRSDPGFGFVERSAMHAAGVFQRIAGDLLSGASAGMQTELLPQPDRAEDELEHAAESLAGIAAAIDHVIVRPRAGMVAWIEMRGEQAELREAPVDVSVPLAETVFDPAEALVLTSATLSVGGRFDFIRDRVGIGATRRGVAPAVAIRLSAPGAVHPARRMRPHTTTRPRPCRWPRSSTASRRASTGTRSRCSRATDRSSACGLSCRNASTRAASRASRRASTAPGGRSCRVSSQIPAPCCSATSSFWEGVDIPGDRLRCVVIDKLPFPVPTDPLVRARSERLRDPFGEYILPVAIIRLRQGFGRLIRSGTDRGAVVLCDRACAPGSTGSVSCERCRRPRWR